MDDLATGNPLYGGPPESRAAKRGNQRRTRVW